MKKCQWFGKYFHFILLLSLQSRRGSVKGRGRGGGVPQAGGLSSIVHVKYKPALLSNCKNIKFSWVDTLWPYVFSDLFINAIKSWKWFWEFIIIYTKIAKKEYSMFTVSMILLSTFDNNKFSPTFLFSPISFVMFLIQFPHIFSPRCVSPICCK